MVEEKHPSRRISRNPTVSTIVGAMVIIGVLLIFILYTRGMVTTTISELPWVIPLGNGFLVLVGFCVAFLAFGRWQVLHDLASFWVGIAFSGFAVGMIFNVLTFPGLLPDGRAIIGHRLSTAAWVAIVAQLLLCTALLAAVLVPRPREHAFPPERWRYVASIWILSVGFMYILFLVYEQNLPIVVGATGSFNNLSVVFAVGIGLVAAIGAILAARYYLRSGDSLLRYVTLCQIAMIGVSMLSIAIERRYDFWWFMERILWVATFLIMFFGLLSEYVGLFRREQEKTRQLNLSNKELEAERMRWQGVVEGIAEEVWVCDAEGKMTLINLPEETAMGLEQFSNKTVHEVLEDVEILNPDGQMRDPEQAPLLRSLKGAIVRGEEIMRQRRTGRMRYRQFSSAPMRDAEGAITGAVAIVRDISNLKLAEEALRRSQTLLSEAEKLSHTGAWVWDLMTNEWSFSDEWLNIHGVQKRTLSPDELILMAHPEDRPAILKAFKEVRNGIRSYAMEYRSSRSDTGEIRVIKAEGRFVKDQTGKVIRVYGFAQDITEQKRAEEALKERTLELQYLTERLEERVKERTKELANLSSQLVSAQENERRRVSYDLHDHVWQTLVAIRFGIERLFAGLNKTDVATLHNKSKEVMAGLLSAVGKIRSMQGDLWPYVLDDVGILATIDWYCREFQKKNPGLAIETRVNIAEHEIAPSVRIVIYRFMQEALNNAAQHSQANHVILCLNKNDDHMELIIEDNGIGFDPQEAVTRMAPWGGLGLLGIKARTELCGGIFGIESVKGQGTTVRASWPI